MTKKLEELLLKYKKANRLRLNAHTKRSRLTCGRWDDKIKAQVFTVKLTKKLLAEMNADIEKARLNKLVVSAELRAYCKKKKYHIQWGLSNQVMGVLTHTAWLLRKYPNTTTADKFLSILHKLKLSTQLQYF